MEKKPDFYYREEGTFTLLLPQNETARKWTGENLHREPWQDENQIAVEPRYFEPILEGIQAGGMVIERIGL